MAASEFLAYSEASKRALKSANILKSLKIDILIEGEEGVGKELLAHVIAPLAETIDAKDRRFYETFENINQDVIIIKNFHKILDLNRFYNAKREKNLRIIALSEKGSQKKIVDDIFGIKIYLPPLREREEDVIPLAKLYLKEAEETLLLKAKEDFFENFSPDLSLNAKSLKKSVYKKLLSENMSEKDIVFVLENFCFKNFDEGKDYRYFLKIFDFSIIKAGLRKFGSQLKLSKALGLNRNTLRKKIKETENLF